MYCILKMYEIRISHHDNSNGNYQDNDVAYNHLHPNMYTPCKFIAFFTKSTHV